MLRALSFDRKLTKNSGVLGLVAYPAQGLMKTITGAAGRHTRQQIREAVRQEGLYRLKNLDEAGIDENQVLERFHKKIGL